MLIKTVDDKHPLLRHLDTLLAHPGLPDAARARLHTELKRQRARWQNLNAAAEALDALFRHDAGWALLHDLNLPMPQGALSIDHLLINRKLDVYVVDSHCYQAHVELGGEAGFIVRYGQRRYPLSRNPIAHNAWRLDTLATGLAGPGWDTRLALPRPPRYHNVVLLHAQARIDGDDAQAAGILLRADHLKAWLHDTASHEADVPEEALLRLAEKLRQAHQDEAEGLEARLGLPARLPPRNARDAALQKLEQIQVDAGLKPAAPACVACGVALTPAVVDYCREHAAQLGHRLLCRACQPDGTHCQSCRAMLSLAELRYCKAHARQLEGRQLCRNCQPQGTEPPPASAEGRKRPLVCDACHSRVSSSVAQYCWRNKRRFDGRLLCKTCQTAVG